MIVLGIECPKCLDKIWSRHRHDWRRCSCKAVYVDGGRDYLRMGFEPTVGPPRRVWLNSETDQEVPKPPTPPEETPGPAA